MAVNASTNTLQDCERFFELNPYAYVTAEHLVLVLGVGLDELSTALRRLAEAGRLRRIGIGTESLYCRNVE